MVKNVKELKEEVSRDFLEFLEKEWSNQKKLVQNNISSLKLKEEKAVAFSAFYNAYNSHVMSKYTKYLFYATLLLAFVAILQFIGSVFGKESVLESLDFIGNLGGILAILFAVGLIIKSILEKIQEREIISKIKKRFDRNN